MRFTLPLWLLIPLIVVAEGVLVFLGFWQWQRNEDKQALERIVASRSDLAPLGFADAAALPLDELDYHRVTLSGQWDTEHVLRVGNSYRSGVRGEEAVVPLRVEGTSSATAVLVNRGWYPLEERERVLAELRAEQSGTVEGLARYAEGLSGFYVESSDTWARFDPEAMREAVPYETVPWAVLEGQRVDTLELRPGIEVPMTGWVRYQNETPHLGYALQWWGLALVLPVFVLARAVLSRGRGRAAARQGDPLSSL